MRRRLAAIAWSGAVLAAPALSDDTASGGSAADAGAPTVPAVWNEQQIAFTYFGLTSYYSCDGLENKVVHLLKALGVREDFKVRTAGCFSNGVELHPRVRIDVANAVPATPERLEALEKDRGRRELIGRVNKQRSDALEATQQFAARTRRVEIKDTMSGNFQAGDCELLEQLVEEVLPKLDVNVIDDDIRCVPKQVRNGSIKLVVEVLEPVPPPEEEASQPLPGAVAPPAGTSG